MLNVLTSPNPKLSTAIKPKCSNTEVISGVFVNVNTIYFWELSARMYNTTDNSKAFHTVSLSKSICPDKSLEVSAFHPLNDLSYFDYIPLNTDKTLNNNYMITTGDILLDTKFILILLI